MNQFDFAIIFILSVIVFAFCFIYAKLFAERHIRKILAAPERTLSDVLYIEDKRGCAESMKRFIISKNNHKDMKFGDKKRMVLTEDYEIDQNWLIKFVSVCHWCGLRIVLSHDDNNDLETANSPIKNWRFLRDYEREYRRFNIKKWAQFIRDKEIRKSEKIKVENFLKI